MKIAFYAPLKSPEHPVPSGDRQMARQLMAALRLAGHEVLLASELRSYQSAWSEDRFSTLCHGAEAEIARLSAAWQRDGVPDLWLCYHPYFKAPDLIGPKLARDFNCAYATAESSYAPKRDRMGWAPAQAEVATGLTQAQVNICFTRRDREGILMRYPGARVALLPPFLDFDGLGPPPSATGDRMIAVAMMRGGDKMDSFSFLAGALSALPKALDWQLALMGDGPMRAEVEALFARFGSRVDFLGEGDRAAVARALAASGLYVWPGCGEAYGLAYLEAQAAGLPVVALDTAGVPDVVEAGVTGELSPSGDRTAYAENIAMLLTEPTRRRAMGHSARAHVLQARSLRTAAVRLDEILRQNIGCPA